MAVTNPSLVTMERVDEISEALRFLGDPTRLRIIALMAQSETCVCDLTEQLNLSQPLISYHLGKLRNAGLVRTRRDGHWVYYSLDPEKWISTLSPVHAMLNLEELPPAAAMGGRGYCAEPD